VNNTGTIISRIFEFFFHGFFRLLQTSPHPNFCRNFNVAISISVLISIVCFRRNRNSDEIPYRFRRNLDVEIGISISVSMSKWNFDSDIGISTSEQEFNTHVELLKHLTPQQVKNSVLIIYPNFYFDRRNRNSDYF
jgi:hypothetical protein